MRRGAASVALVLAAGAALAAGTVREVELEKLNRVYSDLAGELAPLAFDPVTVRLSSPRQVISVRDHVARLTPLGGGRVEGTLELELLGKGDLVADVDLAGRSSRLADTLILPPQRIRIEGAARLERAEGGYRIRAERLPRGVPVEIRSNLVNQVVELCDAAALLSLGALECAPLARALERPTVPFPASGGEYFLSDAELDDADRAELDALIAAR